MKVHMCPNWGENPPYNIFFWVGMLKATQNIFTKSCSPPLKIFNLQTYRPLKMTKPFSGNIFDFAREQRVSTFPDLFTFLKDFFLKIKYLPRPTLSQAIGI